MSSVKKLAVCVFAGAAASASIISIAQTQPGARLVVNDEAPLALQGNPGFSYVAAPDGATSALNINTDGYLFCANIYYPPTIPQTTVTLALNHVRWTLPTGYDAQTIGYTGGVLGINKPANGASIETSLTCRARGANGEVVNPFSPFGDGVFRNGLEPFAATQYANMLNWRPSIGFSWSTPDWSQVPTDSCSFDTGANALYPDAPQAGENALCTAASGMRVGEGPDGATTFGQRAATMWTYTDGTKFVYLARIDARLGPNTQDPNTHFDIASMQDVQAGPNTVDTAVRDGFDSTYLSASGGLYCQLNRMPTSAEMTANLCSTVPGSGSLSLPTDGRLQIRSSLSLSNPHAPATSFYVAVVRRIAGAPPSPATTPVAAISVLADPDMVHHDAGDGFVGDDVVFGFMPTSSGFPWMGGQ